MSPADAYLYALTSNSAPGSPVDALPVRGLSGRELSAGGVFSSGYPFGQGGSTSRQVTTTTVEPAPAGPTFLQQLNSVIDGIFNPPVTTPAATVKGDGPIVDPAPPRGAVHDTSTPTVPTSPPPPPITTQPAPNSPVIPGGTTPVVSSPTGPIVNPLPPPVVTIPPPTVYLPPPPIPAPLSPITSGGGGGGPIIRQPNVRTALQ